MICVLDVNASMIQQTAVISKAHAMGLMARPVPSTPLKVALGALTLSPAEREALSAMPGVRELTAGPSATPLCSRVDHEPTTVVHVGAVPVGGPQVVMMAGPCAVESLEQLRACAKGAQAAGARILRGGAFKPRTSPYAFMGLEEQALSHFAQVKEETGLAVVTEVMAVADIERISSVADALQVGARNMQNYPLLRALGRQPLPILLKRGPSATYEEWLLAAEYIHVHGNGQIMLCERGIRTFEPSTRNTLDVAAVPVMAALTHLPMVVDPSHGTGARAWVPAMGRAAVAAGADALMIEAHPDPDRAQSDGPQSLTLPMLADLGASLGPIAQAIGRHYPKEPRRG
jgi:3-deoxy-7-phosphoheptulonate synthase